MMAIQYQQYIGSAWVDVTAILFPRGSTHADLTDTATNGHPDTAIAITPTYTGNAAGATTQKAVNDKFDAFAGGSGYSTIQGADGMPVAQESVLECEFPVQAATGKTVIKAPTKNFLNYIPSTLWDAIRAGTCTDNLDAYFALLNADFIDGDVLVIPPGSYYTTTGIRLTSKANITVSAWGVTLVAHPDLPATYVERIPLAYWGFNIITCSHINVYGIALDGNMRNLLPGALYGSGMIYASEYVVFHDTNRCRDRQGFRFTAACSHCAINGREVYDNDYPLYINHIDWKAFNGTPVTSIYDGLGNAWSGLSARSVEAPYGGSIEYEVEISANGTPDTFVYRWKQTEDVAFSADYGPFNCTLDWYETTADVPLLPVTKPEIKFDVTTGHTIGDTWSFAHVNYRQSSDNFFNFPQDGRYVDVPTPELLGEAHHNYCKRYSTEDHHHDGTMIQAQKHFTMSEFDSDGGINSFWCYYTPTGLADSNEYLTIEKGSKKNGLEFGVDLRASSLIIKDLIIEENDSAGIYITVDEFTTSIVLEDIVIRNCGQLARSIHSESGALPIYGADAGITIQCPIGTANINSLVLRNIYIHDDQVTATTTGIKVTGDVTFDTVVIDNVTSENIVGDLFDATLLPYVNNSSDTVNAPLSIYVTSTAGTSLQDAWDSIPAYINDDVFIHVAKGDYSAQTLYCQGRVFLDDDKRIYIIGGVDALADQDTTLASDYAQATTGDHCLLNTTDNLASTYDSTDDGTAYFVETCTTAIDGYSGIFNVAKGRLDVNNLYIQGSHNISTNNASTGAVPSGSNVHIYQPAVTLGTVVCRGNYTVINRCKVNSLFVSRKESNVVLNGCHVLSINTSNSSTLNLYGCYCYGNLLEILDNRFSAYRSFLVGGTAVNARGLLVFSNSISNIGAGTEIYIPASPVRACLKNQLTSNLTLLASSAIGIQLKLRGSGTYALQTTTYSNTTGASSVDFTGSTGGALVDGEFDESQVYTLTNGLIVSGAGTTSNTFQGPSSASSKHPYGMSATKTDGTVLASMKQLGDYNGVCDLVYRPLSTSYTLTQAFQSSINAIITWEATGDAELHINKLATAIGTGDADSVHHHHTLQAEQLTQIGNSAIWNNVLASRATATYYQNNRAYPIHLNVMMTSSPGTAWNLKCTTATASDGTGAATNQRGTNVQTAEVSMGNFIIPAGKWYKVEPNLATSVTVNTWDEFY